MARILMAWELGANFGHLTHQLPIAKLLREAGHEVWFAVRDTSIAADLLTPQHFPYVQAPRCHRTMKPAKPLMNYAELLLAEGYGIPSVLLGQLAAWTDLLRLVRADIVIGDHSPTAILAARVVGIRAVAMGSGFSIPPDRSPLPSIRPWLKVSAARLVHSERLVIQGVNAAIRRLGGRRELEKLGDAFAVDACLLATFPELDHYGTRDGVDYLGPIFGAPDVVRVGWSTTRERKIVAYLRNGIPGLGALLRALGALDAETLCAMPGVTEAQARRASIGNLRIVPHAVDLDHLLQDANATICTAGVATTSQSLLAGVPLLLVPCNADQYMFSIRASSSGGAITTGRRRDVPAFAGDLEKLLANPEYRERARQFARAHEDFAPHLAVTQAAAAVERAIVGGGLH